MNIQRATIAENRNQAPSPKEPWVYSNQGKSKGNYRLTASERLIFSVLEQVAHGFLVVTLPNGLVFSFGNQHDPLQVHWEIHHPDALSRIIRGGSLGLGESYVDGWWRVEDDNLVDFFGLLLRNQVDRAVSGSWIYRSVEAISRLKMNPSSRQKSQSFAGYHYNLSNQFFSLFLDPTMTYSCGYMKNNSDPLELMQKQKYELISTKLELDKNQSLVDIGCGWGGMLFHAATNFGQRVSGITLSKSQYAYVARQIVTRGLQALIGVSFADYRELKERFDRVVSIGMFEHVGHKQYPVFMQVLRRILAPQGRALLHTIGTTDEPARPTDPWISKYIFPGGRMPRLEELAAEARKTGLLISHVENLKPHYAETLSRWRTNFALNRSEIMALGTRFQQPFLRMWDYYLQCSEASFRYGTNQLYQLVLTREEDGWPLPLSLRW